MVASVALKFAIQTAIILNQSIPSAWPEVADNLLVLFNETSQMHPEYQGYTSELIKQPDVVLIGYPLMYEMPENVRANDLRFYSAVTDPDGPTTVRACAAEHLVN